MTASRSPGAWRCRHIRPGGEGGCRTRSELPAHRVHAATRVLRESSADSDSLPWQGTAPPPDRRPDPILGCCNQNLSLSESARPPVARGHGGDSEPGGTGRDGRAGQPGRLLATGASPGPGPPGLFRVLIRPSPACQPPLATSRRAADADPGHHRDVCGGRLSSSGGARPPGPLECRNGQCQPRPAGLGQSSAGNNSGPI
jgi:hypothetical protein